MDEAISHLTNRKIIFRLFSSGLVAVTPQLHSGCWWLGYSEVTAHEDSRAGQLPCATRLGLSPGRAAFRVGPTLEGEKLKARESQLLLWV